MSEPRYTVTEVKRLCWQLVHGEVVSIDDYLAMLPPDPEPSGEVVERTIYRLITDLNEDGTFQDDSEKASTVAEWHTAEVTRQVEERTKVYREALSNVSKAEQAVCYSQSVALTREFELMSALRQCGDIARQALANKGGSDE